MRPGESRSDSRPAGRRPHTAPCPFQTNPLRFDLRGDAPSVARTSLAKYWSSMRYHNPATRRTRRYRFQPLQRHHGGDRPCRLLAARFEHRITLAGLRLVPITASAAVPRQFDRHERRRGRQNGSALATASAVEHVLLPPCLRTRFITSRRPQCVKRARSSIATRCRLIHVKASLFCGGVHCAAIPGHDRARWSLSQHRTGMPALADHRIPLHRAETMTRLCANAEFACRPALGIFDAARSAKNPWRSASIGRFPSSIKICARAPFLVRRRVRGLTPRATDRAVNALAFRSCARLQRKNIILPVDSVADGRASSEFVLRAIRARIEHTIERGVGRCARLDSSTRPGADGSPLRYRSAFAAPIARGKRGVHRRGRKPIFTRACAPASFVAMLVHRAPIEPPAHTTPFTAAINGFPSARRYR